MGNRPPFLSIEPKLTYAQKNSVNLQQKFYGTLGLSPEIGLECTVRCELHTKLPKWSLWDFIDVGKDRTSRDGRREKYLAEGLSPNPKLMITISMTGAALPAAAEHIYFHQLIVLLAEICDVSLKLHDEG